MGGDLDRWDVEPLVRERRGLDERMALALPRLMRRIRARVMRYPLGSARRRAALTRAVRLGFAATNRDDHDVMRSSLHPDVELYPPGKGQGGLGFEPVYRGPDGVVSFVEQWKSGFERFVYEPREIADAGGERFAVRVGMLGTATGGTPIEDEYGVVITLKDGVVHRQENLYEWDLALAALRRP